MLHTTQSIFDALKDHYAGDQSISLSMTEGEAPVINLQVHSHGDLPIQLVASGQQILVSTPLVGSDRVNDRAAFDRACLLLNPVNPLSNLGLTANEDGSETYVVFGELSANSDIEAIDEEIRTLADNTIDAAESFRHHFN
ncbi:YjfI family protein [Stenotrophomonas maltophilia]|uniref:YjfI family protein n=1 Tax=Stenotrophomonas maltophilia TaxID=40324 RepID=UPI0021C5CC72|nr:YjfI family protein [Stenotrophomonas maltophilia]MCU1136855.1 DUF2170 family protein [Stenotrophomonas maltophilia]